MLQVGVTGIEEEEEEEDFLSYSQKAATGSYHEPCK
jgi:hypothetical protein